MKILKSEDFLMVKKLKKYIKSDDNLYCKGLESQFYVRSVFDYRV